MATKSPISARSRDLEVRRLTYADLPRVLSVERRSFPAPWSLAMFVLELSKANGICLAAETSYGMVGYMICSRYADVWHLMNVAVAPEARRLGVATALIGEMFARGGGDERYTLEVRASNHEAVRMYERLGFHAQGRRSRYYHDNGEDAVIMWFGRADG